MRWTWQNRDESPDAERNRQAVQAFYYRRKQGIYLRGPYRRRQRVTASQERAPMKKYEWDRT